MDLTLKVIDGAGAVKAEASNRNEVFLVFKDAYEQGDRVVVEASEPGHLLLSLDDALSPTLVYLKGKNYALPVPFELDLVPYSPRAFAGENHCLQVRKARPEEVSQRRNLALNPLDDKSNATLFPHAHATAVTRGEAKFAARNAIDGEKANNRHGPWPHTSWGIDGDPTAVLTVEFGRPVAIDEVVIYLRADFPHDAWWKKASVTLSTGEVYDFDLEKTGWGQSFAIAPQTVEWVKLHGLVKADDPSDYPALTQFEVWGRDTD